MVNPKGKIIIGPGLNIWPHELKTAEALATAGYTVEFTFKDCLEHDRNKHSPCVTSIALCRIRREAHEALT